jgi:hypothetical protein
MTDRELMQQALEALKLIDEAMPFPVAKLTIKNLRERLAQTNQEPLEYWNAVEGWVKIDEVRKHFDSVGCGTIYKTAGDGRVPLTAAHRPDVDAMIALVRADERNKLAAWMIQFGFATGHGDTMDQLLEELRWQVEERGQDAP